MPNWLRRLLGYPERPKALPQTLASLHEEIETVRKRLARLEQEEALRLAQQLEQLDALRAIARKVHQRIIDADRDPSHKPRGEVPNHAFELKRGR